MMPQPAALPTIQIQNQIIPRVEGVNVCTGHLQARGHRLGARGNDVNKVTRWQGQGQAAGCKAKNKDLSSKAKAKNSGLKVNAEA